MKKSSRSNAASATSTWAPRSNTEHRWLHDYNRPPTQETLPRGFISRNLTHLSECGHNRHSCVRSFPKVHWCSSTAWLRCAEFKVHKNAKNHFSRSSLLDFFFYLLLFFLCESQLSNFLFELFRFVYLLLFFTALNTLELFLSFNKSDFLMNIVHLIEMQAPGRLAVVNQPIVSSFFPVKLILITLSYSVTWTGRRAYWCRLLNWSALPWLYRSCFLRADAKAAAFERGPLVFKFVTTVYRVLMNTVHWTVCKPIISIFK